MSFRTLSTLSILLLCFIVASVVLAGIALLSFHTIGPVTLHESLSLSDLLGNDDGLKPQTRFTIFIAPPRTPWIAANGRVTDEYRDLLQTLIGTWLDLIPCAKVVVMAGRDSGATHPGYGYGNDSRVSVETNIDHNFRGTPQVHSMFARASWPSTTTRSSSSSSPPWVEKEKVADISVLVMDPGLVVNQGFLDGVYKTLHMHQRWVLFSRRLSGGDGDGDGDGEVEYWVWTNDRKEEEEEDSMSGLFSRSIGTGTTIPPFAHIPGTYEHWIIEHLIGSGRVVVDASEARLARPLPRSASPTTAGATGHVTWESYINSKLSSPHSNVRRRRRSAAPWKLVRCAEPMLHNLCMLQQSPQQKMKPHSPEKKKKKILTESHDPDSNNEDSYTAHNIAPELPHGPHPWKKAAPGIPHSLDELLPQVADENNVVVMVGGTSNYKEMLLSYICRVQSLGVKSVLVAAFDEPLFEFAYLQGLAVYLESSSEDSRSLIGADGQCIFASECFKQVSKLKSSSVLRVLRKGYSVLWSDMDIFWFKNPLPQLRAFGPGTLPIQSDEPDELKPENSIRGANSGFYFARSDEKTIRAFRAIVGHAMGTDLTEQPSFYDVLCGVHGERRVGERQCNLGDDGVRTMFLRREEYPNGHVFKHWESRDALESCAAKGCVILHNNYIEGKGNKVKRFVMNGMWYYDVNHRMCIQPWHPMSLTRTSLPTFRARTLKALNLSIG